MLKIFNNKRIFLAIFLLVIIYASYIYQNQIYNYLSSIKTTINKPINYIHKKTEIIKNYDKLYETNKKMEQELMKYKEVEEENKELKKTIKSLEEKLNFSSNYSDYEYEYANILFRNINYWNDSFTIDKGRNYGIKVNDPIIYNSLIGRVSKVYDKYSVVTLITNNNENKISVKIKDEIGSIIEYKNNYFIIKGINNYDDIKEKEKVYTTGYGTYKANLPIGEVEKIKKDNYGISNILYVKPNCNFNNIKYVMVIKWFTYS